VSPLDESALLKDWDRDILFAARAAARRFQSAVVDADDFAQVARIHLLLAARRHRVVSPRYIRRVIKNAILSAIRREVRHRDATPGTRLDLTDELPAPSPALPDKAARVIAWVTALPDRLRLTYDALYVARLSQRDAAGQLGVSQPRVAQLHAAVLAHGRRAITVAA
jgi:RNA polymerase sigma factor (sigma-70 family)